MIALYRARLFLAVAASAAVLIFALEFPFSELLHQRGQLSVVSAQLGAMQARNNALQGEIVALKRPSTIEAIAHEDYGLVRPGQLSYVILPAPSAKTGGGSLTNEPVPIDDLVAAPVQGQSGSPASATPQVSVFSRFVQRLEFWR